MFRRATAVVFALMLCPRLVSAQEIVLTVTALSADVHKGPSTVTPVVGRVTRGTVLLVSRDLGSWVKVPWPNAEDGAGYLHVTTGRVGPPRAQSIADAPSQPAPTSPTTAAATTAMPVLPSPPPRTPAVEPIVPRGQTTVGRLPQVFGVGGLVGSPASVGATARLWRNKRLGFQFGLSRDVVTNDLAPGRVTSVQVEPGVLYGLFDHVSDYLWVRPYVGAVASFRHQTFRVAPASLESVSDNGVGFRVFGGSELKFSGLSQFGLSVDLGYRRVPAPFAPFEHDRLSASIAGHWYIK
jgi:hypothetical protein